MGGGDTRALPSDKDQEELLPSEISRLSDAPALLFVYFHKAFRAQLVELRRLTADAAENGSYGRILAAELCRKFEFLKLVYKYHCAAEDEVIFLALDSQVKNIAFNYLLEHAEIDDLFSSIFHWLHVLEEDRENKNDVFREVVFCIGTIQSSIHQHMLKEERQVFPLLIEKFSFREQSSLMWQYICSVPVMLLEDLLPWIMSFLSSEEQTEVENCMKEIVPNDDSLQQVVSSWLLGKSQSFGSFMKIMKGVQCADRSESTKNSLQMHQSSGIFQRFLRWSKSSFFTSDSKCNPIDGLQLWHNVIKKGLRDIQEELCQIEVPSTSLHLDVMVVRLNFLTDVLIFYSNAFKRVFYPLLEEIPDHHALPGKQFLIESYIENLQRLLYQNAENKMEMSKYCLKLKGELESLIMEISKQFAVQETEVFPMISQNCSHELQQQILYMSLHVLPLGLLKCVIIWFSGHLSEHESQSILLTLSREDTFPNKSFANLLLQWFRLGFSGKISVENFGKELSKMFKGRCFFQKECTEEASGSFSHQTELQLCNGSKRDLLCCPEKGNKFLSHLLSLDSSAGSMYQTPYSSGMNQQIFFPGNLRLLHTVPDVFYEKTRDDPLVMDLKPVDILFFFHKAMKNDLNYLVSGSAKLAADFRFLGEFQQQFHLMKFMYQIHSDAEDEIAFPALEAKGRLENISQSYTIDHELEVEHFNKVSVILNEMSELDFSNSTVSSNVLDLRKQKYEQLCLSLQDICKSMRKLLSEHIHREEIELWSLFRECFSVEEQEKIMARMLGRIPGETLQDMIPWLMESLTPEEQHAVILLWRHTTRKTMFAEWLAEWYDGHGTQTETEVTNNNPSGNPDPLEIVWKYLHEGHAVEERGSICCKHVESLEIDVAGVTNEPLGKGTLNNKTDASDIVESHHGLAESKKVSGEGNIKRDMNQADNNNPAQTFRMSQNSRRPGQPMQYESLLTMSQEDLEATIRRISGDSSLDPQKKSYIMQNLLMSRWIVTQQIYNSEPSLPPSNGEAISGQHPSYRDPFKLIFGCKHYKRNCKLLTPCCNQLFTCLRCHDEVADHLVDRKLITKIMCMKCLTVQPISLTCSNPMCNSLSMGKYYCKICKLFDDERKIYHCPYCNICRVGKGLGIDYFHCMKCNACMSLSLLEHVCREKCLEENCPICHEYIFTSSSPVKALPCGHLMHSACFQEYTCSHYTCPICSKSLGDMQVYFRMLDALRAEETMPDEYSNQTQVILCNDCERKGNAPYHWLYHKCPFCGSYNTRLL